MEVEVDAELVRHVQQRVAPAMEGSAFTLTIAPESSASGDRQIDVKLAVETGLAVLMDKPIVVVVPAGRSASTALRRAAHAVVELDEDMSTSKGREAAITKLRPLLAELTRER